LFFVCGWRVVRPSVCCVRPGFADVPRILVAVVPRAIPHLASTSRHDAAWSCFECLAHHAGAAPLTRRLARRTRCWSLHACRRGSADGRFTPVTDAPVEACAPGLYGRSLLGHCMNGDWHHSDAEPVLIPSTHAVPCVQTLLQRSVAATSAGLCRHECPIPACQCRSGADPRRCWCDELSFLHYLNADNEGKKKKGSAVQQYEENTTHSAF